MFTRDWIGKPFQSRARLGRVKPLEMVDMRVITMDTCKKF